MPDPNFDPRDEIESRPQVSFSLPASFPMADLARRLCQSGLPYHDMSRYDDDRCSLRLRWDVGPEVVDAAADWLSTSPAVTVKSRHYGGKIP
jgi:hypothetical protein